MSTSGQLQTTVKLRVSKIAGQVHDGGKLDTLVQSHIAKSDSSSLLICSISSYVDINITKTCRKGFLSLHIAHYISLITM